MKWTRFTAVSALLTFAFGMAGFQRAPEAASQETAQAVEFSADSNPRELVNVNGTLFFAANDGIAGEELWKSDGTGAGTVRIMDIHPGGASSILDSFTKAGAYLFFTFRGSDVSQKNSELWRSDGTAEGTMALRTLWEDSSVPKELTEMRVDLYFSPQSFLSKQLWKSDGTPEGTEMIKDFDAGMHAVVPNHLEVVDGVLYFIAGDDVFVNELWKSDGAEAGTVRVAVLDAASEDTLSQNLTNVGGVLFFSSSDTVNGAELWMSDGTAAGTGMVKNIQSGENDSNPHELTDVNGTLYFVADDGSAGDELWKSDSTADGTVLVRDIRSGAGSDPAHLTNVGGALFFVADDGQNGAELWMSDGTESGTKMVKDIASGAEGSDPDSLVAVGNLLYFAASDGSNGKELWRSDGTETGTYMVKDIQSGESGSTPAYLTAVNGGLYFTASDGRIGVELWKSDGTEAGTVPVRDINTNPPIFQIIAPNGGEKLVNGEEVEITWRKVTDSLDNVSIELFKGGLSYSTIAESTENDGLFTWTVPMLLQRGTDYSIKIAFVSNPDNQDFSDSEFTVSALPPLFDSVTDDGDGMAFLEWTNRGAAPLQFLGLSYDLYAKKWVDRGAGGSIWFSYPWNTVSGNMDLGYTGAYFVWLFAHQLDGTLELAEDPATILMYSGKVHTPANAAATHVSGNTIELKWDPDFYGTWLNWIIVYDAATQSPVATQGPLGNSVWHYVVYGTPDFNAGKTQLTTPMNGNYWVFVAGMGWDGATWSEFSAPFVRIP